jgi:hypothetical protein
MGPLRFTFLLVLGGLLAAAAPARADWWTNAAGRVIEARLEGFDGAQVTLVRTNGAILKLPLKALCPADQRRVRLQQGQSVVPPFVLTAYKDASAILDKFQRLPAEQQTAEARQKAANMACAVFDGRLRARSAELADQEVLREIKRLRDTLGPRE